MKITSLEIADQCIQIAPPANRPPGTIADQKTDADGVWVRLGKDGPWHKTDIRSQRDAMNKLLRAETAAEGMGLLLQDASAKPEPVAKPMEGEGPKPARRG